MFANHTQIFGGNRLPRYTPFTRIDIFNQYPGYRAKPFSFTRPNGVGNLSYNFLLRIFQNIVDADCSQHIDVFLNLRGEAVKFGYSSLPDFTRLSHIFAFLRALSASWILCKRSISYQSACVNFSRIFLSAVMNINA